MRIKKTLGYGLTDVITEGGLLADPRINPGSPLLRHEEGSLDGYVRLLRSFPESELDVALELEMLATDSANHGSSASDLCTWSGEYGLPEVLLVRPVGFSHWERYGDPIDFEEEAALWPDCAPRVAPISAGIFPFVGLYMDARTGEKLEPTLARSWRRLQGRDVEPAIVEAVSRLLGFSGTDEAQVNVVPVIPEEVKRLCDWAKLFTDPSAWMQLRPMLYVHWT